MLGVTSMAVATIIATTTLFAFISLATLNLINMSISSSCAKSQLSITIQNSFNRKTKSKLVPRGRRVEYLQK